MNPWRGTGRGDLRNGEWAVVPKGLKDSARGFNPRRRTGKATRPEVGGRQGSTHEECFRSSAKPVFRPFGAVLDLGCSLGLKPQAEALSPFGTKTPIRPITLPPSHPASGLYSNCARYPACPTFFRSVWQSIWTVRLRRDNKCRLACHRLARSPAQQLPP